MALEDNRDGYPLRDWWDIAEALARQTFQVQRATCSGTAFLVMQGVEDKANLRHFAFATAWHVISDVLDDKQFVLYRAHDETAIDVDTFKVAVARLGPVSFDLGLIILRTTDDLLPIKDMMPVRGFKTFPSLGEDLGWYGYPGVLGHEPMFCRGSLACFRTNPHAYLINGVAYPGMSGGPVVDQYGWVVGVISEWWGEANPQQIPGMLQAAPSAMIRHTLEDRMGARVLDLRPSQDSPPDASPPKSQ